ncbi:MAG: hypothetical protein WKG52_10310 [Variovorax sp.]
MPTYQETSAFGSPSGLTGAFKTFAEEASELFKALLSPQKLVAEVEQMRALQVAAKRVEATDPERAAALVQRASRLCMR